MNMFSKLLLAFLMALLCMSANVWALEHPLVLPEPKGIYGIGTINVELSNPKKKQLRSFDKRRWMLTVFYPTMKTKATAPYMPGTLDDGKVCGVKVLGHAIPHAPLLKDQKFPVIISFPGRGNVRQQNTILYEALASNGYIVIAMDQPYVANFVKFSDGTKITLTLKDIWNLPRDRDYRYKYDDQVIEMALTDIDFLLDHFQNLGDISKNFDTNKIILMGHSLGANIAHIKGFLSKHIQAVVDIDSKITDRAVFSTIGVPHNSENKPVLFIRGALQYQENVGDQLIKVSNSTVWSPKVQHSAFSDDAFFAATIKTYGMSFWQSLYNWFFKKGPYFSTTDTDLGEYKVAEWFEQYPEYIVKWLDKNIKK